MISLFRLRKGLRGEVLVQNVIFIILNLIFVSMLLLFLWQQSGSEAILEETYSKKIALLVDSAKPVTEIRVNMQDALKASKDNNFDFDKVVSIDQNSVHVKLDDKGGHQYSHFNDVSVSQYPETDSNNEYTGNYIIIINENGSSE